MTPLLVSVIIPTRNSEKTMKMCLDSIVNQTYDNIEIIVNDANSTDDTQTIVKQFKNVKLICSNNTLAEARNESSKIAKGDFLFHVDSDMELSPDLIKECVNKCTSEGYDALIVPEISAGKGFWAQCRYVEKLTILNDKYREVANRFMRKKVFEDVGGVDTSLTFFGEDFDLSSRIVKGGYRIGRVNSFIKHYEITSIISLLKKYYRYGFSLENYVRKHPKDSFNQFFILRPFYPKNWGILIRYPLTSIGLLIMKGIISLAVILGMLNNKIARKI